MTFYRFKATEIEGRGVVVECLEYIMRAETAKGYWISPKYWLGKKRWVSKTSRKRFAYPTKAEAIKSFIERKRREKEICDYRSKIAHHARVLAEHMLEEIEQPRITKQ